MALPKPDVALDDVCAVVHNNTLYTYSSEAFQSLPLVSGGNWTQLAQGESVTGGVCVGSTPGDASQAGFFVVGGKSSNNTYQGLQKYTYTTGKWESISPVSPVTQSRLWHGATYLNASNSILMYAGSQDGSPNLSSQTFTISTVAPYGVTSYQSVAPPTVNPILLPWSQDQAVLIGGCDTNAKVMLFSPASSWVDSGASLAEPIKKNTTAVQATIVKGDDQCISLYTFDMTQSPNQVNRTLLINGAGAPVQGAVAISSRSIEEAEARKSDVRLRRANLNADDWPKYNSSLAPSSVRSNYAVAQDPNGRVVITGGNKDDVLCVFDGRENSWVNATAMLGSSKAVLVSSSSASSTATATSTKTTATPTTASAAATSTDAGSSGPVLGGMPANTVLAIALGTILGFAFFLVLIYCLVRRHKRKVAFAEAGHMRRSSGIASDEKNGIGYANGSRVRGAPPGASFFRGHNAQDSQNSYSSMAILMGNQGHKKSDSRHHQPQPSPPSSSQGLIPNRAMPAGAIGARRTPTPERRRLSSDSMYKEQFKSTISKPVLQSSSTQAKIPIPPEPISQDQNMPYTSRAGAPGQPRPRGPGGPPNGQDGMRRSSGWNRYWSGGSTLNILGYGRGGDKENSRRTTVGSEQSSQYSDARLSHAQAAQQRMTQDSATVPPLHVEGRASFNRVNSGSPTVSQYNPKQLQQAVPVQIERPVSHASSGGYSSGIPASVADLWDPTAATKPWGTDRAPSSAYESTYTTPLAPISTSARAQPQQGGHARQESSGGSRPPTGVSQQPPLTKASMSSDMSWLNLGNPSKQGRT
jgi:hypothetical protein